MSDQCKNCGCRGNINDCVAKDCSVLESWAFCFVAKENARLEKENAYYHSGIDHRHEKRCRQLELKIHVMEAWICGCVGLDELKRCKKDVSEALKDEKKANPGPD